jgi:tRNA nucleotidyltransferase (CCA-adding enzyme)
MNATALLETLPDSIKHVLETARTCLSNGQLYVVGGLVRDVLFENTSALNDLDLVVENTKASEVASRLQQKLGGQLECHESFGTCTLELEHILIDIVTARREHYDPPGSLPSVSFSNIQDDLARRDFSINALAVRLAPEPLEFLDPCHGLADLQHKHLRILHPNSFIDDPTRILRGARLAGRLGFSWEAQTRAAIEQALSAPSLNKVSKDRFKQELELTLSEAKVTPALEQLRDCQVLSHIFNLTLDAQMTNRLDSLRQTLGVPNESYLLSLLLTKPETELAFWLETFNYPSRYFESLHRLRKIHTSNEVSSPQFAKLNEAEKITVRTFSDALAKRIQDLTLQFMERRLTGKDVLDLGLKSGPDVGTVLAHVAKARDMGEVCTFEDELALAQQLVQQMEKQ